MQLYSQIRPTEEDVTMPEWLTHYLFGVFLLLYCLSLIRHVQYKRRIARLNKKINFNNAKILAYEIARAENLNWDQTVFLIDLTVEDFFQHEGKVEELYPLADTAIKMAFDNWRERVRILYPQGRKYV